MTAPFDISQFLARIADQTEHIYYFGSTALLSYRNKPLHIYHILTDLNVALIGQLVPDLQFDSHLRANAIYQLTDQQYVYLLSREKIADRPIQFLKKVRQEFKGNGLFNFFYHPLKHKYFTIGSFYKFSSHKLDHIMSSHYEPEDLIDICLLKSELDCQISTLTPVMDHYLPELNIKSYLPLLELAFTSTRPYSVLKLLHQFNLLKLIFPFLYQLKGIQQDKLLHPEGDVFDHTLNCFRFVKSPSLLLFYGLLLHDYGKIFNSSSKKKFYQHSTQGAGLVRKILKPYGYQDDFIEQVKFLVEYHMVNSYFYRIDHRDRKTIFNNQLGIDLMKLFKADTLGSIGQLDIYQDIFSILKKDKSIKCFS